MTLSSSQPDSLNFGLTFIIIFQDKLQEKVEKVAIKAADLNAEITKPVEQQTVA